MDIFDHAHSITDLLAETVSKFEVHCAAVFERPMTPQHKIEAAIKDIWPYLIADAQKSIVSPEVQYLAALYDRLAQGTSVATTEQFTDRSDFPWNDYYKAGCGDEPRCEDGWVIAELFWGGYVPNLQLTLGWLFMDAIRIQQGLIAITPVPNSIDRFTENLRWSGPDVFDAESLRALFYEYERKQSAV